MSTSIPKLKGTAIPEHGVGMVVEGLVQGVGFRPFVSRLATAECLTGWVRNAGQGVEIAVFGAGPAVERFKHRLRAEAPPLAKLTAIREHPVGNPAPKGFSILPSESGVLAAVTAPDAGICHSCRLELFDPGNRRHLHAFISCTDCGPRFSIQTGLPYDRVRTSMARFEMCADCALEYGDASNRRYHAEPIACHVCGPVLWLERKRETQKAAVGQAAILEAQDILRTGGIVAIKGIGGFHLACNALDETAINRLRTIKSRLCKPFALMVRDLDVARRFVEIDDVSLATMQSPAAPIVLLNRKPGSALPESLAPGLGRVGIMLPHSGLHALILEPFDQPLVMTSANAGTEPQVTSNDDARMLLANITDAVLMHDRDIVNRVDDSLVETDNGRQRVLRRARGFAPAPIGLPPGFPVEHPRMLATGGDLKNAFAFAKSSQIILSQHIGELESLRAFGEFETGIERLERLFDCDPEVIVVDVHPGYRARQFGAACAEMRGLKCEEVYHHHAHAAAVMIEHGFPLNHPPVLALVQDGIGLGPEGALWGAELLWTDYRCFRRFATLKPAALPGGDRAASEPWRNLVARLIDAFGEETNWPKPFRKRLEHLPVCAIETAIGAKLNCPLSSSAGRLFDAVAAALGLCVERLTYEGEAAMRLQYAAEQAIRSHCSITPYSFGLKESGDMIEIDPAPLWTAIAEDIQYGISTGEVAARFHAGWVQCWSDVAEMTAKLLGADPIIILTGGVMQNKLVAEGLASSLGQARNTVYRPVDIPANDGGIAVGQIAVALARHAAKR